MRIVKIMSVAVETPRTALVSGLWEVNNSTPIATQNMMTAQKLPSSLRILARDGFEFAKARVDGAEQGFVEECGLGDLGHCMAPGTAAGVGMRDQILRRPQAILRGVETVLK